MPKILDLSGLSCPHVLLETKQYLKYLKSGEQVSIMSTDPSALVDFQVFTRQTPHALLEWKQVSDNTWLYIIQKN